MKRTRLVLTFLFCVLAAPLFAETGFQSVTITFGETWTGNAYKAPDYSITGSEGVPIDDATGGGVRINLVEPFLTEHGTLTIDPRITMGTRRYLVYQDGSVVPAPQETGLGLDESGLRGLASARILTVAVGAPVGLELALAERIALTVAFSPTLLFRFPFGQAVTLDEDTTTSVFYPALWGSLRWLRPEFHIAGRFDLSDYFAFTIRGTTSVSLLDLFDATLPWWDRLQAGLALDLCLTPPFSGLFRGLLDESNEDPAVR